MIELLLTVLYMLAAVAMGLVVGVVIGSVIGLIFFALDMDGRWDDGPDPRYDPHD